MQQCGYHKRYVEWKKPDWKITNSDSIQVKFKNSQKLIYGHRNQKVVAADGGKIDWKGVQANSLG